MEDKGLASIRFKVDLEGKHPERLQVMAYSFDRKGRLLDQSPVQEGHFELKAGADSRIVLGPPPKEEKTLSLEQLERLNAYQPYWKYNPEAEVQELLPIPEQKYKFWLWCWCRVTGKVVKPTTIGGITYNLPVCHARVHICEVDPLWIIIPRLPDPLVWRLRDDLLKALQRPFPIPIPEPDPPFRIDPGFVDPVPNVGINPQPFPPAGGSLQGFDPQPEPPAALTLMPLATRAALSSSSIQVVREELIVNSKLILPYLCLFDWLWPYFYRCDELRVLETDEQGRFDTLIWYLCGGDKPDLYFWVEYCIGGTWTTVYRPRIRCHTYWDYACGSEVVIRVTDPAVPGCTDLPSLDGFSLAVVSVGDGINVHQIDGSGLAPGGRPFGGSLEPHVIFGSGLVSAGITHYKWSYRPQGASDSAWVALDHEVIRHYTQVESSILHLKTFQLGPDPAITGNSLFKIPTPNNLPAFDWAPQVNARANTASAYFVSGVRGEKKVADGLYELKLEVFRFNSGSGHYEAVLLPRNSVQVPPASLGFPVGSVADIPFEVAPNANVELDGSGNIRYFKMLLRVDNNPCEAVIYPVRVGANNAGPCGFIKYGLPSANATIGFKARHPNNFANFSFLIARGSVGGIENPAGSVGSLSVPSTLSPSRNYLRTPANPPSDYSANIPVADLLGSCGDKAAFSETLYVDALATDGWGSLDYLDAQATPLAFALEP